MKYLDLKTLAKESSLSLSTLKKFIARGLPHYNIGRKILVKPEDFDEWMEQFRKSGNAKNELDRIWDEVMSDVKNK